MIRDDVYAFRLMKSWAPAGTSLMSSKHLYQMFAHSKHLPNVENAFLLSPGVSEFTFSV